MVSLGKHIVVNVKNIADEDMIYLCDVEDLEWCFFGNIPMELNLKVVRKIRYQFKPHGATILYLLSTSHMSIHTFVEQRAFAMDLYTCDENVDLQLLVEEIKKFWKDVDISYQIIDRNCPISS